jgi:predicted dienelactone hydrolase
MQVRESNFFKWKGWLKLTLGSLSIVLAPGLMTAPGWGAERIQVSYGIIQRSLPIDSLETYARTGNLDESLAAYVEDTNPKQLAQLRQVLLTEVPLDAVQVSQFLYSSIGESVLERLKTVIETEAPEAGFYALRAALILAAADPEGLTLLNVLEKFPLESISIDLGRVLELAEALNELVSETNEAITQINQQSMATSSLAADIPSANLSQLGPLTWQEVTIMLNDSPRDRTFPVDLYLPVGTSAHPVIVISHGLGSDRTSFAYLAQHLVSYGFVVVVPEHPGSNTEQLQALLEGRADQVTRPREFIDRPLDVTYLLDELSRLSQTELALQGRMNLDQVGVVGQSFGGYTALALAGATLQLRQLAIVCQTLEDSLNVSLFLQCLALQLPQSQYDLSDSRIKAAIAINPVDSSILGQVGLSQIDIPVMIVSSSADTIAPALLEQIQPFTWLTTPNKYLVLLNGGTHFSTIAESPNAAVPIPAQAIGPSPAVARDYVEALSVAFLKTYVANQPEYRAYLSSSYANTISRAALPLSLVRSLSSTQLTQIKTSVPALSEPD